MNIEERLIDRLDALIKKRESVGSTRRSSVGGNVIGESSVDSAAFQEWRLGG